MKESLDLSLRMNALLRLLEREQPHVIALQENMVGHYDLLKRSAFLRERGYFLSGLEGQEKGFKVSLLSRFPFASLRLVDACGRPALIGLVPFSSPPPSSSSSSQDITYLTFASVHLTSGNNATKRAQQIRFLHDLLLLRTTSLSSFFFRSSASSSHADDDREEGARRLAACFMMGDFNACQPSEDDASVASDGFRDLWLERNSNQAIEDDEDEDGNGWTRRGVRERLDRITLYEHKEEGEVEEQRWRVEEIKLVAKEEVAGAKQYPYISDHLGLCATLRLRTATTNQVS
ncbi:hypothetical protein QOT17_002247 [Balamuthia mandrillaris]